MTSSGLRGRIARLPELRHLTDSEAAGVLADRSLVVNEPVRWEISRGTEANPSEVRMSVRVFNSLGENLRLRGRISIAVPECSHWVLGWGDKRAGEHPAEIRRLDLRDGHRNPDGERWIDATHKHLWSAAEGNRWAYTPTDIPHSVLEEDGVCDDDYRAIFEAFASECRVGLGPDYRWTDPRLDPPAQVDLWEVP